MHDEYNQSFLPKMYDEYYLSYIRKLHDEYNQSFLRKMHDEYYPTYVNCMTNIICPTYVKCMTNIICPTYVKCTTNIISHTYVKYMTNFHFLNVSSCQIFAGLVNSVIKKFFTCTICCGSTIAGEQIKIYFYISSFGSLLCLKKLFSFYSLNILLRLVSILNL